MLITYHSASKQSYDKQIFRQNKQISFKDSDLPGMRKIILISIQFI